MTSTTVKAQAGVTADPSRGTYVLGSAQAKYLRTDWTLERLRSMVAQNNEPLSLLYLPGVAQRTWGALSAMLHEPVALLDMQNSAKYTCEYLRQETPSLMPLYLLTADLEQYAHDKSYSLDRLMRACLNPSAAGWLNNPLDSTNTMNVPHIQSVMMGTGHTADLLPSDGTAIKCAQFAELTNGDILVLAGFEWFEKP